MMRNFFKGFLSVTASALIAFSAVPYSRYSATSAVDSFVSMNVDNTRIVIDKEQIITEISPYNTSVKSVDYNLNKNIIRCSNVPCEMLDRVVLAIGVTADSGLTTEKLQNINIYLDQTLNGADCAQRKLFPSEIVEISENEYEIQYNIVSYGTDFSITSAYFSEVENLAVSHFSYIPVSGGYVKAQAKTPDGENLFVSVRKDINEKIFCEWLKSITMYINSLKDVTGFSRGTMYMFMDDAECVNPYSANYKLDQKEEINGFTTFSLSATDEVLDFMETNPHSITWCILHELSHSYACHIANNSFDTNYNYHDEVHTNVRGITALQNCDNLHDMLILDGEAVGTYNDIYSKRNPDSNDFLFYMAKKTAEIGTKYGWNKLKFFLSADTHFSDYDHSYNCENNLAAADVLKNYLNLDVSVTNPEYLKFVNVLHRLYMLCWDHPEFNAEAFEKFIATEYNGGNPLDNSGNDLIQRFVSTNIEKPLDITEQPRNLCTEIGSYVSATVTAVGQSLNYQWFIYEPDSTVPVPANVNSPEISYTLTEENNGRQLFCEVSDRYGKKLTTKTVTIGTTSQLIVHPANVSAYYNEKVSTTVTAKGCGLVYQWYERNKGAKYWTKSRIKGATYSCEITPDVCGREFYCVITDAFGKRLRTRTASMGLNIKVLIQPTNDCVAYGETAKSKVVAGGEGLSYQWFVREKGTFTFVKSDITSPEFTRYMTKESNGLLAYCEIYDIFGNTTRTNSIRLTGK